MKKRFLSLLCLACAVVLLLSSCVTGMPLSEVYLMTKEQAGSFASNVDNLFRQNAPIILDGESNYIVSPGLDASERVRAAAQAFCDAVETKTGYRFDPTAPYKDGTQYRIRLINPERNVGQNISGSVPAELNAANFYIGFSGKDLLIEAYNDTMLISALAYLTENYITDENANAGDGYFYLPGDFSYLAPTLAFDSKYAIVYPDGDSVASDAATTLATELNKATGLLTIPKSDLNFRQDITAKEILIGAPVDRVECDEILETLAFNEYYIGTLNNKILILATNAYMLGQAVDEFLASFVTADKVTTDKTAKALSLPAYLQCREKEDLYLLCERGKSAAVLVYAAKLGPVAKSAIHDFAALFEELTGAELPVYSDAERPQNNDGKFEILIGATNRRVSDVAMRTLPIGEWRISTSDEGICVAVHGDNSACIALQYLTYVGYLYSSEFSGGSDRASLLAVPGSLAAAGRTIPDLIPLSARYRISGGYRLYRYQCEPKSYENYLSSMSAAGFAVTPYSENEAALVARCSRNGEEVFVTYEINASTILVTYRVTNTNAR